MNITYTAEDVQEWVGPAAYRTAEAFLPLLKGLEVDAQPNGDLNARARLKELGRVYLPEFFFIDGCLSSRCQCRKRHNCAHGAAISLAALARYQGEAPALEPDTPPTWEDTLAEWLAPPAPRNPATLPTYRYRLAWTYNAYGQRDALQVLFARAKNKSFKPMSWFNFRPTSSTSYYYGTSPNDIEPHTLAFVEPLFALLARSSANHAPAPGFQGADSLVVREELIGPVLTRLALHPWVEDQNGASLVIHGHSALRTALSYEQTETGTRLVPVVIGPTGPIDQHDISWLGGMPERWFCWRHQIFKATPQVEAAWRQTTPILVPEAQRALLERKYLPTLAAAGRLAAPSQTPEILEGEPIPQLILTEGADGLSARPGFLYGDERVETTETVDLVGPPTGPLYRRAPAAETKLLAALGLPLDAAGTHTFAQDDALDFLRLQLPRLAKRGWDIVGQDHLPRLRLTEERPVTRLIVSSGIDWFDLESALSFGEETVPWPALQRAIESEARYVRLGSGAWARLPDKWLLGQRRLLARLGRPPAELGELANLRVPKYHAPLIQQALQAADHAEGDTPWQDFQARLASFGGIVDVPVPAGFKGSLRPYQRQGLNYLCFLRDHGLHGILADDMGLGKTVQAAALLAAKPKGTSLIVAPASVVANWAQELKRFAPKLKVLLLHGADRQWEAIDAHDVVITTYATARLDEAQHLKRQYHTLILDEAQMIKNPASQTSQSLCRFKAAHRLCLTGTPIENGVADLWSLFKFLMPDLLGSERQFRSDYATPVAAGDKAAARELKTRVAPFILRRLKSEVARDLPPRTDITVYCELAPAQRRAYDTLLLDARQRMMEAVAEQGFDRSRITILSALLKLRQVCCHPALLGKAETLHLESGKLDAALELIQEIAEGGHRALVFSQFTSMLAILRERLTALGIPYEYLDGGTRDRQARVDRFNAGTTPLFLISLKAGGTGLNLTGADYVLHYDPWWNPAVEDQATDRAHRIGQTRQVFNYKLVARDTIEEKLVKMQETKRGLVRDLLDTDAAGKQLTLADFENLFAVAPKVAGGSKLRH